MGPGKLSIITELRANEARTGAIPTLRIKIAVFVFFRGSSVLSRKNSVSLTIKMTNR